MTARAAPGSSALAAESNPPRGINRARQSCDLRRALVHTGGASSMCERRGDSTTLPPALVETTGPFDDSFGYRVTEEGLKALAEYEKRHSKRLVRKVRLPAGAADALEAEAWHERRHWRRKLARERGHRLLTVCGKNRGRRRVPDLRLMGVWRERAGFKLGRLCEVEVEAGTLTIRAI